MHQYQYLRRKLMAAPGSTPTTQLNRKSSITYEAYQGKAITRESGEISLSQVVLHCRRADQLEPRRSHVCKGRLLVPGLGGIRNALPSS